jgi:hypothetical protein
MTFGRLLIKSEERMEMESLHHRKYFLYGSLPNVVKDLDHSTSSLFF